MVLTDLKQGQSATIQNISSLDQVVKKRLTDFGFHVGSKIQYKRSMPFGGPFVIETKGQSIAIRKKDAGKIEVNL
ncbi:FeoA family protein [Fervidibacillus halotolerans]|uniref:Ferrous iron transport protein A n=1 Tax=Fervidibacillus halotolerans TaxID=2980027 RepID=A0A9E8M0N5_9BACI|nr:FeoA family protein [Fervidibacillus halotolerans]WAA12755.1 ferrous iron transport protein A [Fervidibacillus halotolerans]